MATFMSRDDSDATWGSPLHAHSGYADIVVLKLDSSGTYQWHTFYGSSNYDRGYGIAVDASGNVYVTGHSDETWGSPLHAHSGSYPNTSGYGDIFVLKLDDGGAYHWHTFYGSRSYDSGTAIALDGSGNVYIQGTSHETWGSPLHAFSLSYYLNATVVLKLNSSGAYQWHTFYETDSFGTGIAVDGSGNVYLSGSASGALKLDTNGAWQWQASFGSGASHGVVVDGSGNVYVTGSSSATWGYPIHAHSGLASDLFVLKLAQSAPGWPDFNGDGRADILWRHATYGTVTPGS